MNAPISQDLPPATSPAEDDRLRGEADTDRDNLPLTEPGVEEESESETPTPPIPEPEKFANLVTFIEKGFTVRSIEGQVGRMINCQVLTDKALWQTPNRWDTAKRAMAKLKDPAQLVEYWRVVVFLRGRNLGNPRAEAILAGSYAILDVVGEMMDEVDK